MARHIDADLILPEMESKFDMQELYLPTHFQEFIVNDIPTADVAPVRHGHWNIGYFHDRVCSCCLHPDNDLNDYAHSYCPHCGAKMDKTE